MTSKRTSPLDDADLEAQISPPGIGAQIKMSSLCTMGSPEPPISDSTGPEEEHSHHPFQRSNLAEDESNDDSADDITKSGWRPWKPDEPYHTKIPESKTTMEDWIKAMDASDDGMCKGWKDQIDTLIIFAGLFSATVTAFAVESYQWLDETPANTLARLQLRNLLNATQNPAMDRLAPATFHASATSVLVNTFWFASLTIALTAVVVSILCRQWLYEYQRYDNFTTMESFLIHGLRYQGLYAWRVPEIIATLPILLQTALVFFLIGVLVLLWSLQTIVASIITAIVGITFLFLGATTVLPAIQYIFPNFDTVCAYKSSQSWSFFVVSAFWLFDFSMFTNWGTFDRWEVTGVYNGTGQALSRVYELLSKSADAFHGIYAFLADKSLNPTINADLTLLSDFISGLNTPLKDAIVKATPRTADLDENFKVFQRLEQLKGSINIYKSFHRRLTPTSTYLLRPSYSSIDLPERVKYKYHLQMHKTLSHFLGKTAYHDTSAIFNRNVDHWARYAIDVSDDMDGLGGWKTSNDTWEEIYDRIYLPAYAQWDPCIATHLVGMYSHLLKEDKLPRFGSVSLAAVYPRFIECYHQHGINPSPAILLNDIQDWFNRMESNLSLKVQNVEDILINLVFLGNFVESVSKTHTSDLERQNLRSFAQFFVNFFGRADVLEQRGLLVDKCLAILRDYLDRNP